MKNSIANLAEHELRTIATSTAATRLAKQLGVTTAVLRAAARNELRRRYNADAARIAHQAMRLHLEALTSIPRDMTCRELAAA